MACVKTRQITRLSTAKKELYRDINGTYRCVECSSMSKALSRIAHKRCKYLSKHSSYTSLDLLKNAWLNFWLHLVTLAIIKGYAARGLHVAIF